MSEGAASVVRRVNEHALHPAGELCLQRLQRQEVVSEDQTRSRSVLVASWHCRWGMFQKASFSGFAAITSNNCLLLRYFVFFVAHSEGPPSAFEHIRHIAAHGRIF